jgi:Uncharacterized protein containing a TIR (Toll-Interleukin 1-resistance) domain
MSARTIPEKFLVAFSFAGEQRDLVRSIAEAVEKRLGRGTVFFDEWFEYYLAGSASDTKLQEIYGAQSELVIVCVSERYGGKPWTLAEHDAIRARNMQLRTSKDKKDADRILPLRVGDGDVAGILFNTICPDVRQRPVDHTAELIVNRLRLIVPDAEPPSSPSPRFVYLAEATPDMEGPQKRMRAFLMDLGWSVLPSELYPPSEFQERLEADLRQCVAFVQLLGAHPWKQGDCDRIQSELAATLQIIRFRYRSSDINLANIESTHREFLTASDVIASGFEDFKAHLEKELGVLAQRRERSPNPDTPPLIFVAFRSENSDTLWEKVFQWIYEQEHIDHYQLRPGETFDVKYQTEPCHGFLVVCDAAALTNDDQSPREFMEQCRQIQLKQKDANRRPPVALVYWPPPSPSWARLLRSTPLKLHRVLGDAPTNLDAFFAEVRRVAQ